jgi:hypothetical protein
MKPIKQSDIIDLIGSIAIGLLLVSLIWLLVNFVVVLDKIDEIIK